jgi:DNA primase
MEIKDIKSQLSITDVLNHYNLTPGRNNRLCCPWHSDKTPSLQIYPKTNTWTCFSSKCDAGSGDTIEMIQRMEKSTKYEALKKAKDLLGHTMIKKQETKPKENLGEIFTKLKANYKRSPKAQAYAKSRMIEDEELGYNGGSWQHLKQCIIFPLRNKEGEIVSLYGRSIIGTDKNKHYYLKGRSGLYPNHPSQETEILILAESIIDSVHVPGVKLAMYGTNGLTAEHTEAIESLENLKEIILFFDGDEAGDEAIKKVGKKLLEIKPNIKISYVDTPRDTDINSLVVANPDSYQELIQDLIETRKEISFSFSIERKKEAEIVQSKLDTSNKHNLKYKTTTATYSIKGGITKNSLDAMKVTLVIEIEGSYRKSRNKLDLYEDKQVDKISREASEKLNIEASEIEKDLNRLTDLLDEYREQSKQENKPIVQLLNPREKEQCLIFLKKPNLIKRIDKLIEQSGVIGEENNRISLFCIAASHKMLQTLHALVQGSSGSGKTHLLKQITNLMPVENVIRLTRVTESSFYNYGETELRGKLIVIEDYDGLKEEAEYAFRELQSNEEIISSTSIKDERSGEIRASIKKVKGPIGSLSATTRSEIYEDNLSRCFVIAVDESSQQTQRIIRYQNQVAAGKIDKEKQEKVVRFLGNCMRLLKPTDVVNPYAAKLNLPPEAFKIRRLNSNFQAFIRQITLINQYQRKTDAKGRLITELEDIKTAVNIMFDSIILKIDELDGGLRLFYERLKTYITEKAEQNQEKPSLKDFTQREIRHNLRISKTSLQRYISDLTSLEYVVQVGVGYKKGYRYKITYWDDIEKIRKDIKCFLYDQIDLMKGS